MSWTLFHRGIAMALCVSLTGCCSVCKLALRTAWQEPKAFSAKRDKKRSAKIYREWADQAILQASYECDELRGQPEYQAGFRDGFVDYVYAGGSGEPPPVPPRRFWNADLRSPHGRSLANQWFSGYRHGAEVARDGGYRDLASLESSVFGFAAGDLHGPSAIYGPPHHDALFDGPGPRMWPQLEELPPPGSEFVWPDNEPPEPPPAPPQELRAPANEILDEDRPDLPAPSAEPADWPGAGEFLPEDDPLLRFDDGPPPDESSTTKRRNGTRRANGPSHERGADGVTFHGRRLRQSHDHLFEW